ncbi:phosphate acetyltransferase [Mesoplasma photuris]|uniref:phosphate acetyltransferase n=1 Tax=Mesoplasma photuris TaxID=217731 RepID=UPI0004E27621|nr:phosphate acetyltransferase [Mesoplasma photuris]
MYSIEKIKELLINDSNKKRIILPEGNELKIQTTANFLIDEKIAQPVLIFNTKSEVPSTLNSEVELVIIDEFNKKELVDEFMKIRGDKATLEMADKLMSQSNYIATMLLQMGKVDSMLCGLTYTTADTLRPALQVIKTAPGYSLASSVFIMKKGEQAHLFTDCGFNIKPNSDQLAEITKMTVNFAKDMKTENPEAVLLSYSTNGSGSGEDVVKVREAVEKLKAMNVDFIFEGEMQFDAAYDKETRDKKFKGCKLTKQLPDVFVFPDINAGNIGYKIAQRMGGWEAIGPFVLGLKKPVNDLSRGATLEDVKNTAIITVFQSLGGK